MKRLNHFIYSIAFLITAFLLLGMQPSVLQEDYQNPDKNIIPFAEAKIEFDGFNSVITMTDTLGTIFGDITLFGYQLKDHFLENGQVKIEREGLQIESSNSKTFTIIVPDSKNNYGLGTFGKNPDAIYLMEGDGLVIRLKRPLDVAKTLTQIKWSPMPELDPMEPCPTGEELSSYKYGGEGYLSVRQAKNIDGIITSIYVRCSSGNNAVASMNKGACIDSMCW